MTDRILPAVAYRLGSVIAFVTMAALIKIAESRGARLGELLFFRQLLALPVVLVLFFMGNMFPLLGIGIYMVVATPTVYTRISGIQLTR